MGRYSDYGRKIVSLEKETVEALAGLIDESFEKAVSFIREKAQRVCVTGMGKAGIIAKKISGTLSSTGTRSFYMHPADAAHGDLGMIDSKDAVLVLSNSGESREVVDIIPSLKTAGAGVIAITGVPDSTLGREADIVLHIGNIEEACPLGLAPTSSTTAMLVLGDALALTLLEFNEGFDRTAYAFFHPGGSLGKKLLKVDEIMRKEEECPILPLASKVKDVLFAITAAKAGGAIITGDDGTLCGFFSDGDLRRGIEKYGDVMEHDIEEFMTRDPRTVTSGAFAMEALAVLKKYMIGEIPVVGSDGKPLGLLSLKDLISIGLI